MSRGPGHWQRGILAAVEAHGAVFMCDLMPIDPPRAMRVAVDRAARTLRDAGKIAIWQGGLRRSPLVLTKPGVGPGPLSPVPRLKRRTDREQKAVQHIATQRVGERSSTDRHARETLSKLLAPGGKLYGMGIRCSRERMRQIAFVVRVAEENPELFADVRDQMDRTNKVRPAYEEAKRRLDRWALAQVRGQGAAQ